MAKVDYDFGSYGNGMLASACDESEYAWRAGSVNDFTDGAWSPSNAKGDTWSNSYAAIREAQPLFEHLRPMRLLTI